MRKLFTLMIALMVTGGAFAQSFYFLETKGTQAPYSYTSNGTDIITSGNDVLSSWQTMPFTWNFYGFAVSGYYASDNGYITFDNGATTSFATNSLAPSATGPDNAIYGFWDDWTVNAASGNPDRVRSWTYGTMPNRVHCVQWWSMTPNGQTTFAYTTIRMYEGGDFDIVLDYGNVSTGSGTVGCENAAGTSGTNVAGSPSLSFPDVAAGAGDDVVYSFTFTNNQYDVTVSSVSSKSTVSAGNFAVAGTLNNLGPNVITSLDLSYSVNGGAAVTSNLTGLNIAANGGSYNFSHPTPIAMAGGDYIDVKVWASNLNGSNPDEDNSNDTLNFDAVAAQGVSTQKRVVVEEFTGAWCQFCPDGAVRLDQIEATHGDRVSIISVHDGDDMEFAEGIRDAYGVSSYPSGQIDRKLFNGESAIPVSRSKWDGFVSSQMNEGTPVGVSVSSSYDASTRTVEASVDVNFVDYHAGDVRIALAVVEDSVTGTGTGYNQVNYYNTVAGHPYQGAGNPIVGYPHRHTLRALPTGLWGNAGTVPSPVTPNVNYTENFTFTLDNSWDDSKIHLIAYVYDYYEELDCRFILNSGEAGLGDVVTGTPEPVASGLSVYPNPVSDMGSATVVFEELTEASFEIYNTFGQKVATIKEGTFTPGEHHVYYEVSNIPNGVYFLTVSTNNGRFTEKIVVAK